MSLAETIELIIQKRNTLTNEAKVRSAAIDPILTDLGWDITDVEEVEPEHTVNKNLHVDYALKPHSDAPQVFIEAKKVGGVSEKGEDQLFIYATNQGVPLLVLTDGFVWRFYLSMAAGRPNERLFLSLKVDESSKGGVQEELTKLLSKELVLNGESNSYANSLLAKKNLPRKLKSAIQKIWSSTISGGVKDNIIIDYFCEELNEKFKIKANPTDVLTELKFYNRENDNSTLVYAKEDQKTKRRTTKVTGSKKQINGKIIGFIYLGTEYETKSGADCLFKVINLLGKNDEKFMVELERVTISSKRRLVSRSRNLLFPRLDQVKKHARKLDNKWYLGLNRSIQTIVEDIIKACEIKEISFGKDLKVIWNQNQEI